MNKWTTKPPTVKGWYWTFYPKNKKAPAQIVCIRIEFNKGDGSLQDFNGDWALDGITHWLGPVPEPVPPD